MLLGNVGSMVFRDLQALSSALAALGTLQPRPFVSLNTIEPLVSLSNYYQQKYVWTEPSEASENLPELFTGSDLEMSLAMRISVWQALEKDLWSSSAKPR